MEKHFSTDAIFTVLSVYDLYYAKESEVYELLEKLSGIPVGDMLYIPDRLLAAHAKASREIVRQIPELEVFSRTHVKDNTFEQCRNALRDSLFPESFLIKLS